LSCDLYIVDYIYKFYLIYRLYAVYNGKLQSQKVNKVNNDFGVNDFTPE